MNTVWRRRLRLEWLVSAALLLTACQDPAELPVRGLDPVDMGSGDAVVGQDTTAPDLADPPPDVAEPDLIVEPAGCDRGTFVGDFTTATQALSLLEGYTSIQGGLTITGTTLTDLSALRCLEGVRDFVHIEGNGALTSLAGLERLREATALRVIENDALTSLSGLSFEDQLYGLSVIGNGALTSLAGLERARFAQLFNIEIINNDALMDLSGLSGVTDASSLVITGNDALASLTGLEGVSSVMVLTIEDNDALTSLAGLSSVTEVDRLVIAGNDALTDLAGLEGLERVAEGFYITDNDGLRGLAGLEGLRSVGCCEVRISDNDALVSFWDLQNLREWAATVTVTNNSALCQDVVNALAARVRLLDCAGQPESYCADGLLGDVTTGNTGCAEPGACVEVPFEGDLALGDDLSVIERRRVIDGDLTIRGSSRADLSPLRCLEVVRGDLIIEDNEALTSLDGLAGLVEVVGRLRVAGNDLLRSTSGLGRVTWSWGGLEIVDNDALEVVDMGRLRGANALRVEDNDALRRLGNFSLSELYEGLTVTNNLVLEDISGLDGLLSVDGPVNIHHNPALCQRLVDEFVRGRAETPGGDTTTGNTGACP